MGELHVVRNSKNGERDICFVALQEWFLAKTVSSILERTPGVRFAFFRRAHSVKIPQRTGGGPKPAHSWPPAPFLRDRSYRYLLERAQMFLGGNRELVRLTGRRSAIRTFAERKSAPCKPAANKPSGAAGRGGKMILSDQGSCAQVGRRGYAESRAFTSPVSSGCLPKRICFRASALETVKLAEGH